MSRYTGWYAKRGAVNPPPALVALGEKLLGELKNRIDLGGPPTLVIRREILEGYVEARIMHGQPQVLYRVREARAQADPNTIEGFVTWPTDGAGANALADSPRVVLRGSAMEAIRASEYGEFFPFGLNLAGNVDWRGGNGWVVSWYGPQNRYLDFGAVRGPLVFFKGIPILDVSTFYGADAYVTGAAVTTHESMPYLVVVLCYSAHQQNACIVVPILAGGPTSAQLSLATDDPEYEPVEAWSAARNAGANFTDPGRHPWLFNPDGTEGRSIYRVVNASAERVLSLTWGGGVPTAAHSFTLHTAPFTYSRGLISGDGVMTPIQFEVPIVTFDTPPPPDPGYNGPVAATATMSHVVEDGGGYGPFGMPSWEYREDDVCTGDPWLPIAVDYKADGTVVYARGTPAQRELLETGTWEATYDHYLFRFNYDATPASLYYVDGVAFRYSLDYPIGISVSPSTQAGTEEVHWTMTETETVGLQAAGIDVSVASVKTQARDATWNMTATANALSHTTSAGILAADGNVGVFRTSTAFSSNNTNAIVMAHEESYAYRQLQIVFMDLRCDALFVAVSTQLEVKSQSADVTFRAAGMNLPAINLNLTTPTNMGVLGDRAGETTFNSVTSNTLHYRGWVRGQLVLDFDHDDGVDETVSTTTDFSIGTGTVNTDTIWDTHHMFDEVPDGSGGAVSGEWGIGARPGSSTASYPVLDGTVWTENIISSTGGPIPRDPLEDNLYELKSSGTDSPMLWMTQYQYSVSIESPPMAYLDTLENTREIFLHEDFYQVRHYGTFCFSGNAWICSLAMPGPTGGPYNYLTSSTGRGAATVAVGGPTAKHLFPIWLLAPTIRETPAP